MEDNNKNESLEKALEKIKQLEQRIELLEKEVYGENPYDFDINCPYCNKEFLVELDSIEEEVICPECKNTIEFEFATEDHEEHEEKCSGCDCSKDCGGCDTE